MNLPPRGGIGAEVGVNTCHDAIPSRDDATPLSRRRFVQGIAATAATFAGSWVVSAYATVRDENVSGNSADLPVAAEQPARAEPLTGNTFDLEIGTRAVNLTGKSRRAFTVNGSMPAPLLQWRQGDTVTLRVRNALYEVTSIHWHGIVLPFGMDGVPGISFPGIAPGETFTYRFKVRQAGTYWYHSHSGFQEQLGLYGPIVIVPQDGDTVRPDRDYVVMLSDWTDEKPSTILSNLKADSDYYNRQMPTVPGFFRDVHTEGLHAAILKRRMWNTMRMNPTDFADVSGATYTYLTNGKSPAANWTGIARAGERIRLRFINASASSIFDVRIPGIKMTVIAADGQQVDPVDVDEFRFAAAETYDVLFTMPDDRAYTIFSESIDRSGYARGTLAPSMDMVGSVPMMRAKTWLADEDMMGAMPMPMPMHGMDMGHGGKRHDTTMPGMAMGTMDMHPLSSAKTAVLHAPSPDITSARSDTDAPLSTGVEVDMRIAMPSKRLDDPGPRLRTGETQGASEWRVLTYADLHTIGGPLDPRPPSREMVIHLTGNMSRFIWGFDGLKYSEAPPYRFYYGERLRITLINDTMMNHPIHLHGMFFEVESEDGTFLVRKHTINVQPAKQLSALVTADAPGQWAFHCHLLYHMEAGMFRKVVVA
ncbi:copper resistance system multicopper oxidase [Robbsia andropogonis]|uniref:copper resistance system multicopper oxidase n=1 Tax=Robbsia andropogonis TaxID=28092 RepID=UPI002A6B2E65|nr:copper resistance system multicopper oxidase [Robbsia andropogonis]